MPFNIPDESEAAFAHQAVLTGTDLEIVAAGLSGNGVVSGCAVTAQGSPNMTVAVAVGAIVSDGAQSIVTAGNVTITAADATLPRMDLVSASATGTKTHTAGTAATSPVLPSLPAGHVALAAVYVPAADTTIASNQIVDKRVMIPVPETPGVTTALATDFQTTEPIQLNVMQGSFVATTSSPRIEVEVTGGSQGVSHGLIELFVGPGIAFPLDEGTVAGPKAGVTAYPIAAIAGEYGRDTAHRVIQLSGITVGQTVRWQVMNGVVGYAALIEGFTGDTKVRITPDNQKLYVLSGTTVTPLALGRQLSDHPNATVSGEFLTGVPHVFTSANDVCFHPTNGLAFVADWFGPAVVVVDTKTDRALTSWAGGSPIQCEITQDGSKVFTTNGAGPNNIRIHDRITGVVTTQSTATAAASAVSIRRSPDGTKMAIATLGVATASNRLYVYTVGTGGTTWTLTATCVIGGTDDFPGKIAWEGNNVVWVPYAATGKVFRCQVDTQTVDTANAIVLAGAQAVDVTGSGLGKALCVVGNAGPAYFQYHVLPSTAGTTPVLFDSHNLYPMLDIELSTDDFIYQGTTNGKVLVNQGGLTRILASPGLQRFWGERLVVNVYGGIS